MKLKIEDIVFWILIALIVGVAIWKLVGSPTDTATIIAIALFVATSEIMVWKQLFNIEKNNCVNVTKIDKNVSLSFIKMKNDVNKKFSEIDNKLNNIQNLLNKKK